MTIKLARELLSAARVAGAVNNWTPARTAGFLAGLQAQFVEDKEELPTNLRNGTTYCDYDCGWVKGYKADLVKAGIRESK